MAVELRFEADWIDRADDGALAEARAFARESLFDRAALHADLEDPTLLERSSFVGVRLGDRLVGLASVLEDVLSSRAVALSATMPGAATALVRAIPGKFVAMAPEKHWGELVRAGACHRGTDLQMVRLRRDPLPDPDPRVEPVTDLEELRRFSSSTIAPEHLKSGPYLGIRSAVGELQAIGGVHYVTERLACLANIQTDPKQRRRGLAGAIVVQLIRALERPTRLVLLQVGTDNEAARSLYADLSFRGTRRMGFFDVENSRAAS